MTPERKSLNWILLHSAAMFAVLCSLFTGLRIATLQRPLVAEFEELLPQGAVHQLHFFSALTISLCALLYLIFRIKNTSQKKRPLWCGWHRAIIRAGYPVLAGSLASGWLMFFTAGSTTRDIHFFCALGMGLYLLGHGGLYLIRWGRSALFHIVLPARVRLGISALAALPLFAIMWQLTSQQSHYPLEVKSIALSDHIHIDGNADEPHWQAARSITVNTDGGANFDNGATNVTLRALSNGTEFFLLARWRDRDKSLAHLPLLKTDTGWQVQQDGFHEFNEVRHYEDKFAVLLSPNCAFGAAGTAHLGRKPLPDKPANWHGKGYHYSSDGQLHDLWHWKAVRSNDMYLADDNFIGPADRPRAGERRYTAGYQQDGKESGAYVMNWQWYRRDSITPKRLPQSPEQLAALSNAGHNLRVIPWFDYHPYTEAADAGIPTGSVMPSVLYNSNRFEGDRADVRARARWHEGYWTLEMARSLVTGSSLDVPIGDGICLWVSAFDRAQIAHTRHTRAIRLAFAQ
ncbi:ethylbenzene dehydrogenase-related protein [Microbulbifer sp. YPW1]|uniref:ethylbenzene dehydrogenase-related protein n=1 Tax=Microbulbifer sp. YPW1 TaxID=2745199 RepID=UPI001C625503|nr:ethylbenzene dehydrogenase-related protein [Microbulbifer sp. YPW1]